MNARATLQPKSRVNPALGGAALTSEPSSARFSFPAYPGHSCPGRGLSHSRHLHATDPPRPTPILLPNTNLRACRPGREERRGGCGPAAPARPLFAASTLCDTFPAIGGVMKLLLIRHAIAEEREDFAKTGKDDRLRPLTDEGRKKMKQVARGLQEIAPEIDLLATSPLTRAAQTGAIVDTVYGGLKEVEIEELSPDSTPADFLLWLRKRKEDCIAAVGHEPS